MYNQFNQYQNPYFQQAMQQQMPQQNVLPPQQILTANGDAPPEMKMVYDILHRRHIDGAGTVKALQMLYKEQ